MTGPPLPHTHPPLCQQAQNDSAETLEGDCATRDLDCKKKELFTLMAFTINHSIAAAVFHFKLYALNAFVPFPFIYLFPFPSVPRPL